MDQGEITRDYFFTLPSWAKVVFYLAALIALGFFFYGVWARVRRYRAGRRSEGDIPPLRKWAGALVPVATNRTVLRGAPVVGAGHLALFWGFIGLFVATLIVLIDADVLHPLKPEWSFMNGGFYRVFSLLADVSGLLFLAGLAVVVVNRAFLRPERLSIGEGEAPAGSLSPRSLRRDDWLLLGLLLAAGVGGFIVEGLRIRATQPDFEVSSFVGWTLSGWFDDAGVSASGADGVFGFLWAAHAITALAFIGYLPYSKAWHMVAGWYALSSRPEAVGLMPAPAPSGSGGYDRLTDLTRGELATLDACTRCGRCHEACPSVGAGMPLSPRGLVLALQAGARRWLPVPASGPGTASVMPSLVGDVIPTEWVWSCTTCGLCDDVCPMGIQHLPLIVQMRRHLVAEGDIDSGVQDALTSVMRYGNAAGKSPRLRARWVRDLDFEVRDARKEEVDYLWFVGDYASFDPRIQALTLATARVMHRAGVDFGILYDDERNSGNDVRRVGEEGLFEMMRDHNRAAIESAAGFGSILTTDPHSYHTLATEYGNGSGPPPITHYTELLWSLLETGVLDVYDRTQAVTYHDPCYLGRYHGIYEAPRRVLQRVANRFVEMPRNREAALCCGAGGGRIWMEDLPGSGERPAEARVREAAGLEGVGVLVTACPKDYVMFQDAVKTTGLEGELVVRDVIEVVEESIGAMSRSGAA